MGGAPALRRRAARRVPIASLTIKEKGFTYSAALRKAEVTWDDKSLDAFIADPQKAIPGNVMPFPGVADAKQRTEIIDYLKTVK